MDTRVPLHFGSTLSAETVSEFPCHNVQPLSDHTSLLFSVVLTLTPTTLGTQPSYAPLTKVFTIPDSTNRSRDVYVTIVGLRGVYQELKFRPVRVLGWYQGRVYKGRGVAHEKVGWNLVVEAGMPDRHNFRWDFVSVRSSGGLLVACGFPNNPRSGHSILRLVLQQAAM